MDSVKIFPYCLERSTNIKKDRLREIECPELLKAIEEYLESEESLQTVAVEGIKSLEYAYRLYQEPNILKAKRKMMAGKLVTNLDQFAGTDIESLIAEYNAQVEATNGLAESYKAIFAECIEKNRSVMQRFIGESEYVLRTLPLINKDFNCKLKKYLEVPVAQHNAKIRKLDHQLIRLFTRATMKTSPFSFLTSTCLYDLEEEEDDVKEEISAICEINNYIVRAIFLYCILARGKSYSISI